MIDSRLMQEIRAEFAREERRKVILQVLEVRFGAATQTITAGLEQVNEDERLIRLTRHAATCPSLQAFEDSLRRELPAPPPASTRGKRRSRRPSA